MAVEQGRSLRRWSLHISSGFKIQITAAGFLRADRNIGKLLADASVGGQTVEVTLYASVSYITSEDAHQI